MFQQKRTYGGYHINVQVLLYVERKKFYVLNSLYDLQFRIVAKKNGCKNEPPNHLEDHRKRRIIALHKKQCLIRFGVQLSRDLLTSSGREKFNSVITQLSHAANEDRERRRLH